MLNYSKANYISVVAAGLIDAVLTIIVFGLFFGAAPLILVFILYRFYTIVQFDRTIGMMVFRVFYLNGEEEELNLKEKALASVFVLYEGVDYYKKGSKHIIEQNSESH